MTLFFQYCAPLVEMRRMNYNLTFKRHLGNLSSGPGHDLAGKGHVAYQSICIVKLKSSKVFSSLRHVACLYQKLLKKLLEAFHDLT